jgi:hypothetical protein
MMGRNAFEHVHSDDRRLVETFIGSDDLFLGGRGGVVYRMVRPNKQIVWMQTMVRALDAADPCYTGKHVLVHREVVATQAGIVPFAILNTFDALLDRDWARALIDGAPMSVLLIDVDHFALFLAHEQVIPDTQEEPTSRTDDLFLPFPKHFAAVGTLCGCAGCRS